MARSAVRQEDSRRRVPTVMNEEIRALLERCFPENHVSELSPPTSSWSGRSDTWVILSAYSSHLGCLFPQHGPGRKHEREIELEDWEWRLLRKSPLSYDFSNKSKDIVDLFAAACEYAGIDDYRLSGKEGGRWDVRINRRGSVALMEKHVGVKR